MGFGINFIHMYIIVAHFLSFSAFLANKAGEQISPTLSSTDKIFPKIKIHQ